MTGTLLLIGFGVWIVVFVGYAAFAALLRWNDDRETRRIVRRRLRDLR